MTRILRMRSDVTVVRAGVLRLGLFDDERGVRSSGDFFVVVPPLVGGQKARGMHFALLTYHVTVYLV